MGNSQEIKEKNDALIIYKFLIDYNHFENIVRDVIDSEWEKLDNNVKNRLAFYVGWLGSENKYIEYDTYSIKQEIWKYDEKKIQKKLTINQIIKIDKRERVIPLFDFEISSKTKKQLKYLSHDCFVSLINMRNKLAHDILNINFKNADIIELLPDKILISNQEPWIQSMDVNHISDMGREILSNYIFMKEIIIHLKEKKL
ncbi:hypothetical protein DWW96_01685 [Eubacterium sp. AF17-7]|uniref:hypothetical protein n=1 Tax=Eubacterium sp. AF17-7 TaxID=2293105 RepID=UPI000E4B4498|nr:hypothetical protein [Eubacterium sp. AF17-7]RGG67397.1 hypothetical protein DWW96_01685 [Eubacterium sp. AF17-7]